MALEGRCHCGACTVRLSRMPDSVTTCNCSLCRTTGWRGIYFKPEEVEIGGEFDDYVRADLDQAYLRNFRCARCGTPTHWELLTSPPHDKVGVNANLFSTGTFDEVPVRDVDGASW